MSFAGFLRSIQTAPSAQALKSFVMDHNGDALGADQSGMYLLQPATGRPAEIHVRRLQDSFVVAYEQLGRDDDEILAQALSTRRATCEEQVYRGEAWHRTLLYRSFAARYRIRRYLCAPIVAGDAIVGTLNLGRACETARFDRLTLNRATLLGRAIGERLAELATPVEPASQVEASAQLRADRALLRASLARLEGEATPLAAGETARWLEALALQRVNPLDEFDAGGRRYVLLPAGDPGPADPRRQLSPREREVLRRLAAGETNKAIAFDLGVAASTVSTHLSSAMVKLGVSSRVGLVAAARRL